MALITLAMAPGARGEEDPNLSPAECGPADQPEPGIQGDVPAGETASYNCGVTLLDKVDGLGGAVQGNGHCAYVRNPAQPVPLGEIPFRGSSETMRAVVTDERAVLVSGDSVYDIRDCENPAHAAAAAADLSLCDYGYFPGPGNGQLTHGPDDNPSGTRMYGGGQFVNEEALYIVDMTTPEPTLVRSIPHALGHSVDWFRTANGREYLLSANEMTGPGLTCVAHPPRHGQTVAGTRPGANQAWLVDITEETAEDLPASMIEIAINKPENCAAHMASGSRNTSIAYHSVDNPTAAHFAMAPFGEAGLRIFDIRNPASPSEVAYFNHGVLVHAGVTYVDADRGLFYVPVASGVTILGIQPQVFENLGMAAPKHPWWKGSVCRPGPCAGEAMTSTKRERQAWWGQASRGNDH